MVPLIIMGSASCAKEDYEKLLSMELGEHDILGVGMDYYKTEKAIKYFATYHPEDIQHVREPCIIISYIQHEGKVDCIIPIDLIKEKSGSSALLGVLAALQFGYEKIILCGCPLQGKNSKRQPYAVFQKAWMQKEKLIKPFVRSMSGWTKSFLGEPIIDWLKNS